MAATIAADRPEEATVSWTQFSDRQRWLFLGILFLAGTSSSMDRAVIAILLELLKTDFHLSDTMLGLLGGAPFGLCYALSSIPLARLADRYGHKRVLFLSTVAWSAMTGLCGFSTTLPFLILARMGVGLSEGGAIAPAHALIADYFPARKRGLALAIYTASGTLGLLLASAVGGWVAKDHGWQAAFFAMALLSAPVAFLILSVLREPARNMTGDARGGSDLKADLSALFRKRAFAAVIAGLLFFAVMPFAVIVFTPAYMQRTFGLDIATAGRLFGLSTAVGTTIGSLAGGWAADRLRRRGDHWLLRMPAILLLIDLCVTIPAYGFADLDQLLILHSLDAALLYASLPGMFATVQQVCGGARRATASAIVFVMLQAVGVALGPIILGALSDFSGRSDPALALRFAMITACCSVVPAAILLLWGSRHVAGERED